MKILKTIIGLIQVGFLYTFFVLDNLFCIFSPRTKLPFEDFLDKPYLRSDFYTRLLFNSILIFVIWLMV